ncbi:MAG: hypothetical protein L0Y67_00540 [Gammaproteobacteria bacterium]|nr:hypothetical protein [Gammaproteobacteria bacterium]MCI0590092.1 hypothetical protein [Gammaproteobacteria bacterium]
MAVKRQQADQWETQGDIVELGDHLSLEDSPLLDELEAWTLEDFDELLLPYKALGSDGNGALWDQRGPLEHEHALLVSFNH